VLTKSDVGFCDKRSAETSFTWPDDRIRDAAQHMERGGEEETQKTDAENSSRPTTLNPNHIALNHAKLRSMMLKNQKAKQRKVNGPKLPKNNVEQHSFYYIDDSFFCV
jgi:hypothetical protein